MPKNVSLSINSQLDNLVEVPVKFMSIDDASDSNVGVVAAPDQPHAPCYFYVLTIGLSGGLALWWKDNIDVHIMSGDKNKIVVECTCISQNVSWTSIFVYGPADRDRCLPVWNRIIRLSHHTQGPLLVIGDFNLIGDSYDKQGGSMNISRHIEEFHSFILATQLFEIPSKGLNYTWDNNRKDDASIRERIDRGFANGSLLHIFPHHTLTHYPLIGSDHAPLLYRSCPEPKRQKRFFRFESMWTLENSCEEIIRTFWRNERCTDHIDSLEENLSICANGLPLPPIAENCTRQHFLKQNLEETWLKEEMYWHQRSRVNWLKYGDQNLRFFHLSIIHRSQRNRITMLKNGHGEWVEDPNVLNQLIRNHFEDVYRSCSSSGTRDFSDILACVESVVSNNINYSLESPVTNCEIHKAVKELGALKALGKDSFPGLFF
ncbi:reverse transcriptase [Tanacetum coccineum]